jgi:LysM domain
MLVRDVRSRQRGSMICAALAAFALSAIGPQSLVAQEQAGAVPASHTVKRGDTLWDIAKLYLGDPYLWPDIYRLNTDVIQDPHWIYPGEVLKIGAAAKVVAVTPPAAPVDDSMPPAPVQSQAAAPALPAAFVAPTPAPTPREQAIEPARSAVRVGEYAASPWVDQEGGPRGSGYIMQARDLPGIRSKDQSRMNLYDRVVLAPPVGAVAPEHELYLSYRLGPAIEGFGQIVIPTGVIEIVRSPRNGEAAIGRVVKMFGEVLQNQRLIAYDSSAALVSGGPLPVTNGAAGKIRWIKEEPVLPSLQNYVVIDISRRDGISTGDQIELYQPRLRPVQEGELAIPELYIGRAQVLRVTPYGATAIITGHEQPRIEDGTAVRIAAKMP